MLKNRLKLLFFLSLAGLIPSISYPMAAANPVARKAAMEMLKKGIEKGTTALHWGLTAGPSLFLVGGHVAAYSLLEYIAKYEGEKFSPYMTAHLEKMIKNELKEQGMKEVESLIVYPKYDEGHFSGFSLFDKKALSYSYPFLDSSWHMISMENARKSNGFDISYLNITEWDQKRESSPKYLNSNEMRMILSHEKVHIEKKHSERLLACSMVAPFFSHYLVKKLFDGSKAKPFSFLRSMASAFTKLGINSAIFWSVLYSGEKEADEGVVNDIEILEGGASLFGRKAEFETRFDKNWVYYLKRFIDPHPDDLKRVQRFEERAAQLRLPEYEKGQRRREILKEAQLRAAQQKV